MARKELRMEELVEVVSQWQMGRSITQIKRSVGLARKTIRKYIELAREHGLSRDEQPHEYQYYLGLAGSVQRDLRVPIESSPAFKKSIAYQGLIERLLLRKYMTPKQVYRILTREHAYPLSYSSFKRYMRIKYPRPNKNCLRLEVMAGEEGQVDYGSASKMYDPETGRIRRAHAFVMTLSHSRHKYVEFVFDQSQSGWVECHTNAFEEFDGVPERVVIDNLKTGVLKPNTYDPVFNKAYAECGKHYGFVIDPAKCRRAEHKGKVERKIPVIRQQFLSTYDSPPDIREANKKVMEWCRDDYGMQVHGTTKRKPYEVFLLEEQPRLKPLPQEKFDMPLWKEATIHPDHHIVFEKSYYSLPTMYVGKKVWVRGGLHTVRAFYDGELVKSHIRAYRPGTWMTDENDYPPEKSKYLLKSLSYYQAQAAKYGENVRLMVTKIMEEHAYRNLRKVQGIFRLADKYGRDVMDLACKRCLFYDDYRMRTLKSVLEQRLYTLPLEDDTCAVNGAAQEKLAFIRPSEHFFRREAIR